MHWNHGLEIQVEIGSVPQSVSAVEVELEWHRDDVPYGILCRLGESRRVRVALWRTGRLCGKKGHRQQSENNNRKNAHFARSNAWLLSGAKSGKNRLPALQIRNREGAVTKRRRLLTPPQGAVVKSHAAHTS